MPAKGSAASAGGFLSGPSQSFGSRSGIIARGGVKTSFVLGRWSGITGPASSGAKGSKSEGSSGAWPDGVPPAGERPGKGAEKMSDAGCGAIGSGIALEDCQRPLP